MKKITGPSAYLKSAREGVNTRGANGVFFVDSWLHEGKLFVRNRPQDGRVDEVETIEQRVEPDYLFPLLRGENTGCFRAEPASYLLLPHSSSDPANAVAFSDLPRRTREFLTHHKPVLQARKKFRNFDPSTKDWYGLYSVLDATFSANKVVWREMGSGIIAAAVSKSPLPNGTETTIIPDHKLFIIPCRSSDEADFVAGFLNSDIANFIVKSYAVSTAISTHILGRIPIPRFQSNDATHRAISAVAKRIRQSTKPLTKHEADLRVLNQQIATLVGADAAAVAEIRAALDRQQ